MPRGDKILRRQSLSEDANVGALVDAYADAHACLEMTDRLFTRLHKEERHIAAMFIVDMSGSTKGWINDAEREALILLSESLDTQGSFAIYGSSGWTQEHCEPYPVKRFDQPHDDGAKTRICGICPSGYTRMGAPIRHQTRLLAEQEAPTKLLIMISDGKTDDHVHQYPGEYGIEDTLPGPGRGPPGGRPPLLHYDRPGSSPLTAAHGRLRQLHRHCGRAQGTSEDA